jgi:hypothetical protein
VSALGILKVIKMVLQKIIDTLYISKYKGTAAKDLPDDVAKRNIFFGRRDMDAILKPRTRLPVKVVPAAAVDGAMSLGSTLELQLREELAEQKENMAKMQEELAEQKKKMAKMWRLFQAQVDSGGGSSGNRRGSGSRTVGKAGTIKGSLRYNAKVAMVLKKAKDNAEAHHVSLAAREQQREAQRTHARSRLANRLQSRSRVVKKKEVV